MQVDENTVRRIARFVTWMPILTGAVVVGALAIVFSLTQSPVPPWLLPVIAGTVVVPNLVIGPVVGRSARTRTLRALDLLVDNATLLART